MWLAGPVSPGQGVEQFLRISTQFGDNLLDVYNAFPDIDPDARHTSFQPTA
jgi:hypothetical protein